MQNTPNGATPQPITEEETYTDGTNKLSFPKTGSYIDLCLADTRLDIINLTNNQHLKSQYYDSDYRAAMFRIKIKNSNNLQIDTEEQKPRINLYKTDWLKYRKYLTENDNTNIPNNKNISNNEIDIQLHLINNSITKALEHASPKINSNISTTDKYVTEEIKYLRKIKSRTITKIHNLKKIQNYTPNKAQTITTLTTQLKEIKKRIRIAFHNSVSTFWKNKIRNITLKNNKKHLKIAHCNPEILNKVNNNHKTLPTSTNSDTTITDATLKLNILRLHFEAVHSQNNEMGVEQLNNIINTKIMQLKEEINNDSTKKKHNMHFLKLQHRRRPRRKTNTTQLLHNNQKTTALKNLPHNYTKHYTILFNNCLHNSHFPQDCKIAKTIPIKKKNKDGSNPSSYRPISFLPNISKIFEIIVNESLTHHCRKNNIIPEHQFGFKHKHIIHAITKFIDDIYWARNKDECLGAVLIDMKKAFDTIWLDGLFYKLIKKNFPRHIIKILWKMTHDKKFIVTDGHHTSTTTFSVTNGLQQGTVNSTLLFNIYISDLLLMFGLNTTHNKKAIAFADDLVIYTQCNSPATIKKHSPNLIRQNTKLLKNQETQSKHKNVKQFYSDHTFQEHPTQTMQSERTQNIFIYTTQITHIKKSH
ncbi:uncharacterized protein LOC143432224 [Xylocopa sonorina]|uniref:uncharacterized protein LOC143432224 n=1 Tax=Xylocopa sonorina TaxID=1818115 RepID=UPI00403AA674